MMMMIMIVTIIIIIAIMIIIMITIMMMMMIIIMMMIMIIIIIIIIRRRRIAFKGANRLQHVRSSGPGASLCKSRATHRTLIICNSCYLPHGTKGQLSY